MIIGLPRPPEVLRSPAAGDSAADDGGVRRGPHPRGSDRALLAAELGRSSRPSGPCRRQLVQVVRGGDEAPLTGERFTTDNFYLDSGTATAVRGLHSKAAVSVLSQEELQMTRMSKAPVLLLVCLVSLPILGGVAHGVTVGTVTGGSVPDPSNSAPTV